MYPESKVELKPWVAAHYDMLISILTFGGYYSMMKKAIKEMGIERNDAILDMGAGTGMAACFMLEYGARVVGIDISEEMIKNFERKCDGKAEIIKARIDEPLNFDEKFDKVFISFVLHGFPQFAREKIIENAYNALKQGGKFFILDYNEFSFDESPAIVKFLFKAIECPYAFDFIKRDWKEILKKHGFNEFREKLFFRGYVRLLEARKI